MYCRVPADITTADGQLRDNLFYILTVCIFSIRWNTRPIQTSSLVSSNYFVLPSFSRELTSVSPILLYSFLSASKYDCFSLPLTLCVSFCEHITEYWEILQYMSVRPSMLGPHAIAYGWGISCYRINAKDTEKWVNRSELYYKVDWKRMWSSKWTNYRRPTCDTAIKSLNISHASFLNTIVAKFFLYTMYTFQMSSRNTLLNAFEAPEMEMIPGARVDSPFHKQTGCMNYQNLLYNTISFILL